MKTMLFLMLMSSIAWAKPVVLISYFDAFNRAPFNNSENVATALARRLNQESSPVEIKLCKLNTVFDKAYAQTEECLKALSETPVMVLGLGEGLCKLKVEAMVRNKDISLTSDNEGNNRQSTTIVQGAPEVIGLRYPLPQMYCALTSKEKKRLNVSNNPGNFVCNNTAYQMAHYYPEIQYGFIHVPNNRCGNLQTRTEESIVSLEKMILKAVSYLSENENSEPLPTTKDQLQRLRAEQTDPCLKDYYKRLKGDDEKLFSLLGLIN